MSCAKKAAGKPKKIVEVGQLVNKLATASGLVVAYGGGTDSTAMLIELVRRGIRPDKILFADTGGERRRTMEFVKLFSFWLVQKGFPPITTVRFVPSRGKNKGRFVTLQERLLSTATLPPPAFHVHTCSQRMKIAPQDAYLQGCEFAQVAWRNGSKILTLVGYEAGEGHRVARTYRPMDQAKRYDTHYPLVEWGWDRAKCIEVIAAAGLPQPGKSSCFFCPMMKPAEIRELALEEPEKFTQALELEARALASGKIKNPEIKGLGGRKYAWKDLGITVATAAA